MNAVVEQAVNEQTILASIQKRLRERHPGGANLEALPEGVRHEQDWWYVSVRPDRTPPRRYEYYEALAEVETEMLTEENVIVLLLPTPAE